MICGDCCRSERSEEPLVSFLRYSLQPRIASTVFAETEWFADHLRDRFDLRLRVVRPAADLDGDLWRTDTARCCAERKVEPLGRALAGRSAWVTGLRRDRPNLSSMTDRQLVEHALQLIDDHLEALFEEHIFIGSAVPR